MDDASLATWLALRELADHAARSVELTRAVAATLPQEGLVRVLDLATGAGSNLRYLVDELPSRQDWLLVDRSPTLLAALVERTVTWARARGHEVRTHAAGLMLQSARLDCRVALIQKDLGTLDDDGIFEGRHLVTASALLDLVSPTWLRTLASQCRRVGASALFAVTYDGRSSCEPADTDDELVRRLFNEHQGRDKGLGGPAEGPGAAARAERHFAEAGYVVRTAPSDWVLGPDERGMQRMLMDGWADAAGEVAPHLSATIAAWRARRLAHLDAGRSRIVVGHRDMAAWLS